MTFMNTLVIIAHSKIKLLMQIKSPVVLRTVSPVGTAVGVALAQHAQHSGRPQPHPGHTRTQRVSAN